MALDFSALDEISRPRITFKGRLADIVEVCEDDPHEALLGASGAAEQRLNKAKLERVRIRKMYEAYQECIRRARNLRADIFKGIKRGEDPLELLLQAIEVISILTGDTMAYTESKEDILTIYGRGLGDHTALSMRLEEATRRLERLRRADVPPCEAKRVGLAIASHEELIQTLEKELQANEPLQENREPIKSN